MEVEIINSSSKNKKLKAIFYKDNKKIKTVQFGSKGMMDFTLHNSDVREKKKESYLKRHKKNENWTDYMTAGSLSKYILWNKTTRKASIQDYIKRFKLKLKK